MKHRVQLFIGNLSHSYTARSATCHMGSQLPPDTNECALP